MPLNRVIAYTNKYRSLFCVHVIFLFPYLVTADFCKRKNKKGDEYGMPVSILVPPEALWGYDVVTSAYEEEPMKSWQRVFDRVKMLYPNSAYNDICRLIGKAPEND